MATQYSFGKIVTSGLILTLDAADRNSYSGSGTTWNDMSGVNNHLAISGSPTFSTGNGGYFNFNASTKYATRAAPVSTAIINVSMCVWARPTSLNQRSQIVHNGRETGATGDGFAFGLGDGSSNIGSKLTTLLSGRAFLDTGYTFPRANVWYNIVMAIRSDKTIRWYVNGIQTPNTYTAGGEPGTPTTRFTVGRVDPISSEPLNFSGDVAIVQFYNIELSQEQILQNYQAQKSRFGL